MPIIDKEVIGEASGKSNEPLILPISELFEQRIQRNIDQYGDSVWMTNISTGHSMKYSEISPAVKSLSSALCKRGFQANDVVLIMASNFIEVPLMFYAVWKAGGGAVCLTLNLPPSDIKKRTESLNPKFILTDELRAGRVTEAARQLSCVERVFVIGHADNCTPFDQLLEDDGQACPNEVSWDLDAMTWLMFSSGTTGVPKGIVHTHRSLYKLVDNYPDGIFTGKRFLYVNLMINAGGMWFNFMSSYQHAQIYTMSDSSDANLLVSIDQYKPDILSAFPTQLAYICQHPALDDYDLSSIRTVISGGSTINPVFERQIFDRLPNLRAFVIHYGMSEVGILCSGSHTPIDETVSITKDEAIKKHLFGCAGKLYPNCKLKVIDELTGEKLGPGEIGHICMHTPSIMKEYFNNPKATAEFMQDGWCRSGDRGYYNTSEQIFVIGRYKELIKYRMAHVVPTNIEKHLMNHEGVADAGVVGLPDDVDGELPLAFVVLKPECNVSAEEIITYINGEVMDEEKLRGGVRFIDRIPRNELGKINRPQLLKMLQTS